MGDLIWIILSALLLIIGAVGTIAPVLPGLPLCWGGLLALKFIPSTQDEISWIGIVILGIITVIISILDNVLPIWGTKKRGGNKKVVWGTTVGLLFGFFIGPWGIIFGPFIGALIGALISGHKLKPAAQQASGAFAGYLAGLILKLVTAGFIIFFFIRTLI